MDKEKRIYIIGIIIALLIIGTIIMSGFLSINSNQEHGHHGIQNEYGSDEYNPGGNTGGNNDNSQDRTTE